jgi:hypothetical protein
MNETITYKTCSKCGVEKTIDCFGLLKSSKDGHRYECKVCKNISSRDYRLKNKKPKKTKWCYSETTIICFECGKTHTGNFHPLKKFCSDTCKYKNKNNREYCKISKKKYVVNNPIKRKESLGKSQKKNWNNPKNIERRKKYSLQISVKLKNSLRARVRKVLKGLSNGESTIKLLGCSSDEFIKYIESKFINGMSWDNWEQYGWHLDHIIPLSKAKTKEEMYKLCHYTNFQPLWWDENLRKSDKISKEWGND